MIKQLFFRAGFAALFLIMLCACRPEEDPAEEFGFSVPAVAFEAFDRKAAHDAAFRSSHRQPVQVSTGKGSGGIVLSELSYKIPFQETIDAYLQHNPQYSQAFYSQFGQPFYQVSTYTYGATSKAIAFPIIKNDQVNAVIYGIVSPNRNYVQFTILQNNEPTTLYIKSILQYEYDNLYPSGPEPMGKYGNSVSQKGGLAGKEKYIREQNIEEVTIIKMNKWDSGGGSFGFLFSGINWWKDSNWADAQFEGSGGGSAGQGMSGSGKKHDKFPDYMDPEDDPCNKTKKIISNPKVSGHLQQLKDQSQVGGEMGFKVSADGTSPGIIEGGAHHVELGEAAGYQGGYHNHTPTGIKMFSPNDIIKLLHFSIAQSGFNIRDGFMGMIGSEPIAGSMQYYHYIISFTGTSQQLTDFLYNTNWDIEALKGKYSRIRNSMLENLAYVDNLGDDLNTQGLEKLFFDTLKNMGMEGTVNLQRIDDNGTIQNIKLSSNGNNTIATPCQ